MSDATADASVASDPDEGTDCRVCFKRDAYYDRETGGEWQCTLCRRPMCRVCARPSRCRAAAAANDDCMCMAICKGCVRGDPGAMLVRAPDDGYLNRADLESFHLCDDCPRGTRREFCHFHAPHESRCSVHETAECTVCGYFFLPRRALVCLSCGLYMCRHCADPHHRVIPRCLACTSGVKREGKRRPVLVPDV